MGARGLSHPQHMLLHCTRRAPSADPRGPPAPASAPGPRWSTGGGGAGERGRGFPCGGRSQLATKAEGGAAASLEGCRAAFLKFHFLSPFRGRCFCF